MIDYSQTGSVCVLRLVAPPINALDPLLLDALRAAVRRANAQPDVTGLVITGDAHQFSAGADVNLFKSVATREDAIRLSRVFQEAYQEVEDSAKPVVAAVAGRVPGGALELALACHYRVATEDAVFLMPEVKLGINPGAGGTQRLPRLVGVETALRMLLSAQPVSALEALRLGLVDAVVRASSLLETAASWIHPGVDPPRTLQRKDRLGDPASIEAALEGARAEVEQARPEIIAPRRVVEAVRAGWEHSSAEGLRREQEGFADCMATLATQNRLYVFFATREAAKLPGPAAGALPADARAAVVGMGVMGTGIAQALIQAGLPTVVRDESQPALDRGLERIRRSLQKRVDQGTWSAQRRDEALARLTTTTQWSELARADIVIEAVPEDMAVKHAVLSQIEAVCSAQTIVASNTSTLSLDGLASAMRYPERLVGLHFFNPAHRMPLVEVIRREATLPAVIGAAWGLAKRLGKTPVLVNNREGFLVNRLFVPYVKEAFWLLEEGLSPSEVDQAMVAFGFPMGPLALIDMAGLDVLALTDRVLGQAYPYHGPLPTLVHRLVEAGHLGQKTGAGVYKYAQGDYTPQEHPVTVQMLAEIRRRAGFDAAVMPADRIAGRLVLRMVAEAFRVLQEGVARSEADLDVAVVLGIGFPDFRGGIVKFARDQGLGRVGQELDRLRQAYGERFARCGLLCA